MAHTVHKLNQERSMNASCRILDSTLREGRQTPRIYFTHDQKLRLAEMIDAAGVDIIEVGVPSAGEAERRGIRAITKLGLAAELVTWNRMTKEDIRHSVSV
ncbi:MAG TPA: hypothetical protein ENN69_07740, partial [Spirochaetia bacterium]|nr:hypothetical protein [Spirochaetia bacterium]